jgi:hypothetical protein
MYLTTENLTFLAIKEFKKFKQMKIKNCFLCYDYYTEKYICTLYFSEQYIKENFSNYEIIKK